MGRDSVVVLVVDDVEAQRYAVARALRAADIKVLEASSASEALQQAAAHPDVIVLDIGLPDLSGFEVCQKLKNDPQTARIPVIFLSATCQGGAERERGLSLGGEAYLFQPVDPGTLVTVIRAAITRRAASMGQSGALWHGQTGLD